MYNSFDIDRASENCSAETVEYLKRCQAMTGKQMLELKSDSSFNEAFMLFTRLSLLVTRRRPELGVHCILIHAIPVIGEMKVDEINRLVINRMINALVMDGKLIQSRRVFSVMKQFLSWCEFQGVIESSPLATMSLNKVAGGLKPKPRERVLSDDELEKFWHMWDFADVAESTRWAARFVLCSARRPDEVLRARRAEFDLNRDVWNQGDRNKSGREHSLPISPIMRLCINKMLDAAGDSEWLVPSPKTMGRPASKVIIAQASRRIMGKKFLAEELPEPFEIRDLRRTARSSLSRLNVDQDVARKIMNHSLEGIDRVYNRHDYMDKMIEAMFSYSDFLMDKCKVSQ
ncbi:tyrosine-type recombinase/integrase [Klebsiella grimontii]|uniref:tyrosine-type recombinase/integrase n=1 Tax=Klebsiella grimontii TaxID=2058152 RepID=UPI002115312E|nr:tyrosine-type recombinase/integrase [Klebsiella grimontii]